MENLEASGGLLLDVPVGTLSQCLGLGRTQVGAAVVDHAHAVYPHDDSMAAVEIEVFQYRSSAGARALHAGKAPLKNFLRTEGSTRRKFNACSGAIGQLLAGVFGISEFVPGCRGDEADAIG